MKNTPAAKTEKRRKEGGDLDRMFCVVTCKKFWSSFGNFRSLLLNYRCFCPPNKVLDWWHTELQPLLPTHAFGSLKIKLNTHQLRGQFWCLYLIWTIFLLLFSFLAICQGLRDPWWRKRVTILKWSESWAAPGCNRGFKNWKTYSYSRGTKATQP